MSDFLQVHGLRKSFPSGEQRIDVLKGLDLTVQQGAMVSVSGESGCGKSTLLHLLGGMEKADAGTIQCEGVDVGGLSDAGLARYRNERIGFVFQFHHLLPEFSAVENVMFPLLLRKVPFGEAEVRARVLLAEVGLSARGHHQPGELSGGEQQRVAIARALVGRPRLLLADEPTGNLDEKTSAGIHELLLSIHREHGLTSLIVTHNPDLAGLCGMRLRLVDGLLR